MSSDQMNQQEQHDPRGRQAADPKRHAEAVLNGAAETLSMLIDPPDDRRSWPPMGARGRRERG